MSDPDLTPEEQQVRRLLADARHDEPMPDDVAARLDGVLAGLQDEDRARRTSAATSSVTDLAAARRRRTARTLLIAAAAVVVIGVGISRVDLTSSDGDAGSSAGAADSASEPEAASPDDADGSAKPGRVLVLGSGDFDRRLRALGADQELAALAQRAEDHAEAFADDTAGQRAALPRGWCADEGWGRGTRIAARYNGQRGVLVLRKPSGGTRDVDLYLCGETTPTRSTTVPAG